MSENGEAIAPGLLTPTVMPIAALTSPGTATMLVVNRISPSQMSIASQNRYPPPPQATTESGEPRRVGFELEFSGITQDEAVIEVDEDAPAGRIKSENEAETVIEVVGQDLDEIVQAVEGTPECRIVGVQWHPEYLFYLPSQFRLFRWLLSKFDE